MKNFFSRLLAALMCVALLLPQMAAAQVAIDPGARGLAVRAGKPAGTAIAARDAQSIYMGGDSLMRGNGSSGTTVPDRAATLAGVTTINDGIGGQTSTQIAKRMAAIATTLTFTSNTVQPRSSRTTVTAQDGIAPTTSTGILSTASDTTSRLIVGIVDCSGTPVRGVLLRTSTEQYYFRASEASGSVSCPANSTFTPDFNYARGPIVFNMGRNDFSGPSTVQANVAAVFSKCATAGNDQCFWLDILNSDSEPSGSGNYNTIVGINSALAAAYPGHVIPWRAYLVGKYDLGQPSDVTAHNEDRVPPSLQADGLHLNASGYSYGGDLVFSALTPGLNTRSKTTLPITALDPLFNGALNLAGPVSIACAGRQARASIEVCGDLVLAAGRSIYGFDASLNPVGLINWDGTNSFLTIGGANLQSLRFGANAASTVLTIAATIGDVQVSRSIQYRGYSYQAPTTGTTVTMADTSPIAILAPAGTLAALTVALPTCSTSYDGKTAAFSTTQAVTALTVNATAGTVLGAPSALAVNDHPGWICRGSNTTWYRVQ